MSAPVRADAPARPAADSAVVPGPAVWNGLRRVADSVERVILGKGEVVRLAVCALAARGHLLVEDVPGVGKTTLARALARSIGGTFRRIQFTSDLLPSDILGVSVFVPETGRFDFRPGPLFANVVLADEINRTTPRTQSSLLEAMSEGKVSLDGQTHHLERPFMVIATQNPLEHFGTYPLPESQMDRFLLRIRIGYPDAASERRVVTAPETAGEEVVETLRPALELDGVRGIQEAAARVRVDESLLDYCERVIAESRRSQLLALPVSTRGFQAWYRAAQAWALTDGRDYCVPDDFKDLALPALAHRVVVATGGASDAFGHPRDEAERVIEDILERVPPPV
jgi:MoxR-like ATPase